MSKTFLTEAERAELLKKYQADNLREAPANILDKTLIDNYGSDAEKKRVSDAEKIAENGEEQKGAEIQTGTGTEPDAKKTGNGDNSGAMKSSDNEEAKNFTKEFNRHVAIFGIAPPDWIKDSETIRILSDKREEEDAKAGAKKDPETPPANLKGLETIRLKHTETGDVIYPTVFTYEEFIKKSQPEYQPDPIKPAELD